MDAPFLEDDISFRYRSRASLRVVFSASILETKIPRAISDSTVENQASASALVLKVLDCSDNLFAGS